MFNRKTSLEYEVAIVGGGPAGLAAAQRASARGRRVVVCEKGAAIGVPVHTSGASSIPELQRLGIDSNLWHAIRVVRFLSRNNSATFVYEKPVACVLDVRGLYQQLASKAADAGAQILLKTPVTDFVVQDNHARLIARDTYGENITINCNIVIDASGSNAVLARKACLVQKPSRYGLGAEYDYYAPAYAEDEMFLVVGSEVAPGGYGWAFPYGDHRVRVGVGIIRPDSRANPVHHLHQMVETTPILKDRLSNAQPIEFHMGVIPAEPMASRFVAHNLICAGDAARQASTLLGEGIRFAIEAGYLSGEVASKAVEASDFSESFLYREYEAVWRKKYERDMQLAYQLNLSMSRSSDEKWDERVDMLKTLTSELFAEFVHSHFPFDLLVRIAMRNPSVLGKIIKKSLQDGLQVPGKRRVLSR